MNPPWNTPMMNHRAGIGEIEPGTWTEAIDQELANVFGSFDPDTFAVIGVTGQMHTTVFIDKQGSGIRARPSYGMIFVQLPWYSL